MATINGSKRAATKHGQIITKPTSMGTNVGPYFISVIKGSDVPNWPNHIWHTLVYFSTDHDSPSNPTTGGAGGIWLYCYTGDPKIASNCQSWDDISGNVEFSYLTGGTPTSNPIYRDTVAGDQTETPHVKNIDGTLYMHYHNDDNSNYDGFDVQNTCYATSTDGVNYTRQGINITDNPRYSVGIGHSGYLQGADNPFPFINEKYISRRLHGGGGLLTEAGSESCYQVSDDYINWTPYKYYNPSVGRLLDAIPKESGNTFQYNPSRIDTVVQDGPYWRIIGTAALLGVSGGTPTIGRPIEMLLDDDLQIVSEPTTMIPLGGTSEFDELAVSTPAIFEHGGTTYGMYVGENSSNENSIGIATLSTVSHTWELLSPRNSNKTVVIDEDFTSLISSDPVPSSVTQVGTGGSVDVSPADGFLRIYSATDTISALFTNQTVTLSDYDVIDFYFEGLATQGTKDNRRSFGLYSSQTTSGITQNLQVLPNSSSSHTALKMTGKGANAGGVTTSVLTTKFIGWEDSWTAREEESPQATQHIGIRVIPSLNKAYLLVGGTSEISTATISDVGLDLLDYDYDIPMYMAIRGQNKETGTRWVSAKKFKAVGGLDEAEFVPSPPTTSTLFQPLLHNLLNDVFKETT